MSHARQLLLALVAIFLATSTLTACGDTWRGLKEDTSDNMRSTGQTLEDASDEVEP